ncbi:MAG: 2-C-methyl-D-erythritol 2,4-cyclodiphosphate synthase [Planctomycetota bacterium]
MSTSSGSFRIGHGYDLHRLEPIAPDGPGRPLVIGGVGLDHPLGPVGHSDGDVLLHALTDALLGAVAAPDIGQLFPDTDPAFDGADSAVFVARALSELSRQGFGVVNIDATVVLERPKLAPIKDTIRSRLAEMLGIGLEAVNVKGKTHERVDAVGQGRAVEAHAVVLVERVHG